MFQFHHLSLNGEERLPKKPMYIEQMASSASTKHLFLWKKNSSFDLFTPTNQLWLEIFLLHAVHVQNNFFDFNWCPTNKGYFFLRQKTFPTQKAVFAESMEIIVSSKKESLFHHHWVLLLMLITNSCRDLRSLSREWILQKVAFFTEKKREKILH